MARVRITLPKTFLFSTTIPIRVTDLNYGGHLGNDAVLGIVHEARMRFLNHLGYQNEMSIEGLGLIMADAAIRFMGEGFYGMELTCSIAAEEISERSFDLIYSIQNKKDQQMIASVKTGMVCYDYTAKT